MGDERSAACRGRCKCRFAAQLIRASTCTHLLSHLILAIQLSPILRARPRAFARSIPALPKFEDTHAVVDTLRLPPRLLDAVVAVRLVALERLRPLLDNGDARRHFWLFRDTFEGREC